MVSYSIVIIFIRGLCKPLFWRIIFIGEGALLMSLWNQGGGGPEKVWEALL
jgi:hypothetical protein